MNCSGGSSTGGSADEEEVGPKIARCRYLERSDLPVVAGMIRCRTIETFSEAVLDPRIVYDNACLSLVLENESSEIVAAAMFCNYPNVPALEKADWPRWMSKHYDLENCTESNALFVHLLVWDDDYENVFLPKLLTAVFYTHSYCLYVVIVKPPRVEIADPLKTGMSRVAPRYHADEDEVQVLYVGDQRRVVPDMTYRLAVEEDNDDVVEILESDTSRLRDFYGEFYVSEMLRHPDQTRRLVVGEKGPNHIGAVACLNRRVNLRLLNETFDLGAFGNLRKRDEPTWSFDDFYRGKGHEEDAYSTGDTYEKSVEGHESINVRGQDKSIADFNGEVESGECESRDSYLDDQSQCDAFAIELLSYENKADELRSWGLLQASFECFPDLDHCIVLLPTERPYSPFLDHFTRVPYKPDQEYPMTMYLTHRVLFQSDLTVRPARAKQLEGLENLLQGVAGSEPLLQEYRRILRLEPDDRIEEQAYVFTCDSVIVGAAIVCLEQEFNKLLRGYRAEDLRLPCGRILSLSLMPIFSSRLGFLLSEIARLADYRSLCYRAYENDVSPVTSAMQSLEPRVKNWPQFQRYFQERHCDAIFEEPFALFAMTPRSVRKELVTTRIVVVGASECGLAFVDALALGFKYPNLEFTDITLISTDGHPYESSLDCETRLMMPFTGLDCRAYQNLVPRRLNYSFIKGTVVEIDRDQQYVHIENSGILSYDYLVLACGLQYSKPELKNRLCWGDGEELEDPLNLYKIDNDADAERVLTDIRELSQSFKVKKSIIFYGCTIDCYCALGALLELGLDGSWVTLILPKREDETFVDPQVSYSYTIERVEEGVNFSMTFRDQLRATVLQVIEMQCVEVFHDCDLLDWDLDPKTQRLKCVLVNCEALGLMTVACDALLSFDAKKPRSETLRAASEARLATTRGDDGHERLLIDEEFRTSDRRVYAAGGVAEYSRNLRRHGWPRDLAYCNSREVGEKLADKLVKTILSKYKDRRLTKNELRLPERISEIIRSDRYEKPLVTAAMLPGGYRYLHVRKPGVPKKGDDGKEGVAMTTGSSDTGYFRLRLNQLRRVDSLTCFAKSDFEIQNMISLYGKHEALLGDLKARFSNSEIEDFFCYFRQPWTSALFSDDFDRFLKTARRACEEEDVKEEEEECGLMGRREVTTRRRLRDLLARHDFSEISEEEREKIIAECTETGCCYLGDIEDAVTEFVESHEDELPAVYWSRGVERAIRREIEDSPLLRTLQARPDDDADSPRCSCDQFA